MNQLPLGEKLVPQPRKTRFKISLLTFYAGKKWPSYALQFFHLLLWYKLILSMYTRTNAPLGV